jgi:hypothetical protein
MSSELCFAAGNGNLAKVKQLLQGFLVAVLYFASLCTELYIVHRSWHAGR